MPTAEALKRLIKTELNLEDLEVEDIHEDMPLFGEGVGLDSLDAVELVMLVQKHFGVEIRDMEESRVIFASVRTLADFIDLKRSA
ncbi:MAG: acyl carrier protein [Holophagaceae bacterium]|nr:acyl carrier protein [Holophagaceae bacterium]